MRTSAAHLPHVSVLGASSSSQNDLMHSCHQAFSVWGAVKVNVLCHNIHTTTVSLLGVRAAEYCSKHVYII